jgi:hypothetical protein
MKSNALPAIDRMSAGAMPFTLVDEPTRTRADAQDAAREALDTIAWARTIAEQATLVPDPSENGARRCESADGRAVRMKRYGGSDVELQLLVERDRNFSLSCTVAAQWARPSKARMSAALDLFEAAARAVLDPAPGDEAMLDLRANVVGALQTDGIGIAHLLAATPWRNGGRKAAKEMIIPGHGDPWNDVEGAFVVCVRTFAGITLAIEPLELTATPGMFDAMETLRLLARLER